PLPARHPAGDARQRGNELRFPEAGARVIAARKMESESHDNQRLGRWIIGYRGNANATAHFHDGTRGTAAGASENVPTLTTPEDRRPIRVSDSWCATGEMRTSPVSSNPMKPRSN